VNPSRRLVLLALSWALGPGAVEAGTPVEVVTRTPGLVAFWTFGEEAGQPRVSTGTRDRHPLQEVGGLIARVAGGPFSGYSAELDGKHYFRIPYAETGDLNLCGPSAQVSLFAVVRILEAAQASLDRGGAPVRVPAGNKEETPNA